MINLSSNQKTSAAVFEQLFPDDHSKATAFEIIANQYYFNNFGTTSKSEIDLLLFSLYFEKLEEVYREDPEKYSDYEVSHLLGISQNRVRTLKEQYELKYSAGYDWREEFWKICEKAEYENQRVKLYIRDNRLYTELRHIIESMGSYAETTLTRQLLVITPPIFVDLMVAAAEDAEHEKMRELLCEILKKNQLDADAYVAGRQNLRSILRNESGQLVRDVLVSAFEAIPIVGPGIAKSVERIGTEIAKNMRNKETR